jgi:hypothetical protein
MNTQDFINALSMAAEEDGFVFDDLRARLPLGLDSENNIVVAGQREVLFTHACVTGRGRTEFIRRLILTLSCLYDKSKANFVVISPKRDYFELLRLTRSNVVAPLIDNMDGAIKGLEFARSQAINYAKTGENYGKLFLVLDGLETLSNGSFDCYLPFFNLAHAYGVDIITGVDLIGSLFENRPQDFIGVGNSLISVSAIDKADVVYAQKNGVLTLPISVRFPSEPSVAETLSYVNGLV